MREMGIQRIGKRGEVGTLEGSVVVDRQYFF